MTQLAAPPASAETGSVGAGRLLVAQGVELDLDAQLVAVDGRVLPRLPHKEFELLRFLLEHAGRVLTREEITTSVWGAALPAPRDSTLDVHVRRLRARLEVDPRRPTRIRTLRGIGYVFDLIAVPSGPAPASAEGAQRAR